MGPLRTRFTAMLLIGLTASSASAATTFHQLSGFESGVPTAMEPQNGAVLSQETTGATEGTHSLGVQFTDTRVNSGDGPQQSIYYNITDDDNGNFTAWKDAATLQSTTARRFGVAYDLTIDPASLPAGVSTFASDFRYNQDPDPTAAPNPIPGFQDTGGEYGIGTRFSPPPASPYTVHVVVPFDNDDNPRSFYVNPNPANNFYQLQLGHKYDPVGLGGSAKVYYDNFQIIEYQNLQTHVLNSWETPDNPSTTDVNEALEGWTTGVSALPPNGKAQDDHVRSVITSFGDPPVSPATDGTHAMQIRTPQGITADAFTWGSQKTYSDPAQAQSLMSELMNAERIELDVTFLGGSGTPSFFSFFMHIADGDGHFYQTPASQYEISNLGSGQTDTVTIQFGLHEFRDSMLNTLPVQGLSGNALSIGIGTNEDSISGVLIAVDKLRVISEAATQSADFDGNGLVDGADFLRWQRNTGLTTGATPAQGDANGDHAVNAADLAIWQSTFGTAGAQTAVSGVPEPAAAMLLGLAALGMVGIRRGVRLR